MTVCRADNLGGAGGVWLLAYTCAWVGNQDSQLCHEYGEVYEVWQVQQFIAIAHAK